MPGSEPAARGAALQVMRGAVVERLPLKAIALFFAVVLWLAVSADEPAEHRVAVRLALRTDGRVTLRGEPPPLTATITGRRRDLVKVGTGGLVVRRTVAPGVGDSLQLVVRPADVELPPGVGEAVRVREVAPRVLTLRFAPVPPETARARSAAP